MFCKVVMTVFVTVDHIFLIKDVNLKARYQNFGYDEEIVILCQSVIELSIIHLQISQHY